MRLSAREDNMNITSAKMLANALRNERKKRKLSQSKTAETIGLKQSTVSEFENYPDGTRLETLFKLLAALDLELQITPRDSNPQEKCTWDQEW
ncbi:MULTISPECIES: helix-turn-helix domain-containing protein [Rahnella]|uniref:helix-turn-helix domain-containing protein n=1 Tax=Rahnella sp. CG8 TaxID=2726078 RepID=UPI002101DABE|nr:MULTISPECIES: helix-turn-helix domain-containing protein [Rahnella]